jgi:hypothetical protein
MELHPRDRRQSIGDDQPVIFHQPIFEKFIGNRKVNLVSLQGCYPDGPDPGVKVLLTDFIFYEMNAFIPENVQFYTPL